MNSIQNRIRTMKIFGLAIVTSLGFAAGACSAQDLFVENGNTIAFLGDSITQQGGRDAGGYVNLVVEGLKANGIKVESVKAGIGGHKSNNMLARVDKDVISKKPDIMTLSCGVNDVWHGANGVPLDKYKENITAIVDKVQAANIKVVILTSTLIGAVDSPNSVKLDEYNDFLRTLAKERNLPIADLSTDMKKIMIEEKPRVSLTRDGVHMSIRGNEMMAEGVLRALGLNASQMKVAQESWLDMPNTCPVKIGMTLRQFNKMCEKADSMPSKPKVDSYINDQFKLFIEEQCK